MGKEFMIITCFLAVLSIQAIANAVQVTFISIGRRIYIETDREHRAMYGQVTNKGGGIRIVVFSGTKQFSLTERCDVERTYMVNMSKDHLMGYEGLRENYLKDARDDPVTDFSYSWSDNLTEDQKGFSIVKPSKDTLIFSSAYFPDKLARVIIEGEVVIFVYFDGRIVMKTMKCLYPFERNLINGVKKINTRDGIRSRFAAKEDEAMVKYLKSHPINLQEFKYEQQYIRPYTKEEERQMAKSNREAQMAMMGDGSRVFDGIW